MAEQGKQSGSSDTEEDHVDLSKWDWNNREKLQQSVGKKQRRKGERIWQQKRERNALIQTVRVR